MKVAFELFDTHKDGAVDYRDLRVTSRALKFDLNKVEVLKKLKDLKMDHGLLEYVDSVMMISCAALHSPPFCLRKKCWYLFILYSD